MYLISISHDHIVFYMNYNRTRKSDLKYEIKIKYDLYKIAQKIKYLKFGLLRVLKVF